LSVAEPVVRRGLFVVFEGGEGSGKSTQVELLATALKGEGREVVVTREPGATEVGVRIRSLLLDRHDDSEGAGVVLTPRAEALLYAADRAHHVASVVRPGLVAGSVVISDRYIDSSLAYQGAGRVLPVNEVSWLSAWATGGLRPDLVVLLDVDPAIGLARIADRGGVDRLEGESLAFHERVRYAFLDLAATDPRRYLIVDATEPAARIAELVAERVRTLLPAPASDDPGRPGGPISPLTGQAMTENVPAPPPVSEMDPEENLEPPVQSSNGHGGIGAAALTGRIPLSHVDGAV
jgi:dTMP kinase